MTSKRFVQGGLTVPYVALWDAEREVSPPVQCDYGPRGAFLSFADEAPQDRDPHGALWARYTMGRGRGRAKLALVHPLRQRRTQTRGLCQVCGGEIDTEVSLFVLHSVTGEPIREGEVTDAPPVHEWCAVESLRDCPHLRRGAVAARVGYAQAWGVSGIPFDLATLRPRTDELRTDELVKVAYHDHPAIRHMLAYRFVVSLNEVTPVDLDSLCAGAGAPAPC